MNLKKNAIQGVKWTTIGKIGRSVFQLLQISILARFLPKEAFGLVAMALFLVQFSNIFVDMGMTSAILHRQNATRKEYSSIYWLNILIAIIFYLFLIVLSPFASSFYEEPELQMLIPILGVNLLIIATGRQHRTIMQKDFEFRAIAIIELISYFSGLVFAVLFAINNFNLYSLVYSTLISSLISNALFLYYNLSKNPISIYFRFTDIKPFFRVGGYTMGSSFLDFFSREIDVLIIGKTLGSESLGLYSLAKQVVLKFYSIINPIVTNVLSPVLSSLQKEKERMKHYYLKVVRLLFAINAPFYIVMVVASKEILLLFYGKDYESGYLVLSFLAVAYAIGSISNPVSSLHVATGRTDLGFKWTVFRILITPVVILISSNFGINSVAFSLAVLYLLMTIPLWYIQIKPMAQIKLKEYLSQFIKPLLLLILISIGFITLESLWLLPFGSFLNASIKIVTSLTLFIVLLWLFDRKGILEIAAPVLLELKKRNESYKNIISRRL